MSTQPAAGQVLTGPVRIVGVGLIGTSIALACRQAGLEVHLADRNPDHVRTASGLGAGAAESTGEPQLTVVCVPPDHLAATITAELDSGGVVTDVGSVKDAPARAAASHSSAAQYVGSHPMAGSERSGPLAASAELFAGRPWAITPHDTSTAEAVELVEALAALCGAITVRMTTQDHDRAVARTSHAPHLLAALVAASLNEAPPEHLALSGQGVRDVTRIAAGDPDLYGQIVGANAAAVADILLGVRSRLDQLIEHLDSGNREGLAVLLDEGVIGTRAIPGKHGRPASLTQTVFVSVPDRSGELARLFADAGASGVNIEDVRIDHDPGRPVGQVQLVVAEHAAQQLVDALNAKDWVTHR